MTVTPEELKRLQSIDALVTKLDANPKTHKQLLRIIKEAMPEVPIPELDAAQPIEDEIAKVREALASERDALKAEVSELRNLHKADKTARGIESEREKLRAQGWDAEGIKKIEETMTEKGIIDYDVAAAYVEKTLPADEPSRPSYQSRDWGFAAPEKGDADHELLMSNPTAYKNKMVSQTMNELQAGKGFRRTISQGGPTGAWGGQ
ncbi:MAG TPA: hypothetical protein VMT20_15310 [Terriglobia bacterium]|nr:hypothetical protein [Terriglobia bacterium]